MVPDGKSDLPAPANRERGGRARMSERKAIHTGRNLPVAIGVGAGLGGLAILSLVTVKVTFLVLVEAFVAVAIWELGQALAKRDIRVPFTPIAVGGAVMMALAYVWGARDALAALVLTVIAVVAWRLRGGPDGYVRDVTASIYALIYLPTMAMFVALMLADRDGADRVLFFLILTVCSDSGGYFAGILFGRHPLAPSISPNKTWEGLAGSAVICLAAGAIGMMFLLHGKVWEGLVLGIAAVGAATFGDLVESMMKRDLDTKDMGSILPGHGGILDRIDAMLVVAPLSWLLLTIFLGAR
jgi:phosphatidate cytidylyltransferase